MSKYYYAVKNGRDIGIFSTWAECEASVRGFSGSVFKKFSSLREAEDFIGGVEDPSIMVEEITREDEAIAYVDGSFDLKTFTFSYGMVFISHDYMSEHKGKDDNKDLAQMRNVAGEIQGAMEAMDMALKLGKKKLILHFDYAGIENWAKGNWKTNKDGTKAYKDYYDSIKYDLEVEFVKVKAHSGVKYNELADKLAKEALK